MNAIFITVRTASTRLPQKCLMDVEGRLAIERVIDRAKLSKKADSVILCTTTRPEDVILCDLAAFNGIKYFRGSSEDKLMRWQGAVEDYGVDFFVTADGDDLLCDPYLIDLAFEQSKDGDDFIESLDVPCGAFTYGIKTSALNKVCDIKNTHETEMMVPYFTETGLFKVEPLIVPEVLKRPEIRMTLDYEDDLRFFRTVYKHFGADSKLEDIICYLDAHPEVTEINAYLQEKYLANQKRLTRMTLHEGFAGSL
jgi:spore coat polysaccharide biosynthesis protein SpsF